MNHLEVPKNAQHFLHFIEETYKRRKQRMTIDYCLLPYLLLQQERNLNELTIMLDHKSHITIMVVLKKLIKDGYVFKYYRQNLDTNRWCYYFKPTEKVYQMEFFSDKNLFKKVINIYRYLKKNIKTKNHFYCLKLVYVLFAVYYRQNVTLATDLPDVMKHEDYWYRTFQRLRQLKMVNCYPNVHNNEYGYVLSFEAFQLFEG